MLLMLVLMRDECTVIELLLTLMPAELVLILAELVLMRDECTAIELLLTLMPAELVLMPSTFVEMPAVLVLMPSAFVEISVPRGYLRARWAGNRAKEQDVGFWARPW